MRSARSWGSSADEPALDREREGPLSDKLATLLDLPRWPEVDFAAFGEVETLALSRMQQITAAVMARNWLTIPHVTHHDEADVTALEQSRVAFNATAPPQRLSILAPVIAATAAVLRRFPRFNASLDPGGKTITLKKYVHIGVATDTPMGLLVPVIRDCDTKPVVQLAGELAALSERARTKGLPIAEMSGGSFTISSLGGVGGMGFTPIINAPEVAILGVSSLQVRPVQGADQGRVEWRKMLPLSLSYDHRVINGVDAARFLRALADELSAPLED
jgi:pyruvate dehydrogenase E2 component (dihydrolipoamide acetyltransferase)